MQRTNRDASPGRVRIWPINANCVATNGGQGLNEQATLPGLLPLCRHGEFLYLMSRQWIFDIGTDSILAELRFRATRVIGTFPVEKPSKTAISIAPKRVTVENKTNYVQSYWNTKNCQKLSNANLLNRSNHNKHSKRLNHRSSYYNLIQLRFRLNWYRSKLHTYSYHFHIHPC